MFPENLNTVRRVISQTSFNFVDVLEGLDTDGSIMPHLFRHTFQSKKIDVWTSKEPDLAVPDLADSLEAMLARREAGLISPTSLMTMRVYPTDPSTHATAREILVDIQDSAKAELTQLQTTIAFNAKAKAEAEAKEAKMREEYEAFKRTKTG